MKTTIPEAEQLVPGHLRQSKGRRLLFLMLLLVPALALAGLLALLVGIPMLSPFELWGILFQGMGDHLTRIVVFQLRLPRMVLGLLAGAMFSLSGVLLQDTLQNAIAGPELLGVSAGASLVVAAVTLLGLPLPFILVPWVALVGALVSGVIVLYAARRTKDPVKLSLIGAALTALFNAAIIVIVSLGNQNSILLFFYYVSGSLANRTWQEVQLVLPWALVSIPLAWFSSRFLNVLHLGDEVAEGLGVQVLRTRALILLLSAALVAAVVAVTGPIAFIALLTPHIARQVLRTRDARYVLPISALLGGVLLLVADLFAKEVFSPSESPVGIWTTLLGGILLLVLLRRQLWKRS